MADKVFHIGDWKALGVETITNIYLYGDTRTPTLPARAALIKSAPDNVVVLDAATFMDTGPGRYALPSQAPAVAEFFDGMALADGRYHTSDLIALGLHEEDFGFTFQHYMYDIGSDDYAMRTYVYNSAGFHLSEDAVFVVHGPERHIEQMAVYPDADNFDFITTSSFAYLGNILILKPEIDFHSKGKIVSIVFENEARIPPVLYDKADFIADLAKTEAYESNIADSAIGAYHAMNHVVSELKAAHIIAMTSQTRTVSHVVDEIFSAWNIDSGSSMKPAQFATLEIRNDGRMEYSEPALLNDLGLGIAVLAIGAYALYFIQRRRKTPVLS